MEWFLLIINADDFGLDLSTTDRILSSYKSGRITSASAMMFMSDTERSAELALEIGLEVGLHLNFTEQFSGNVNSPLLKKYHQDIASFLLKNKYFFLLYNPNLRKQFHYVYKTQYDEYLKFYNRMPNHINGHHHMHLCANILFDRIISKGMKVRKNFSFSWRKKNLFNICYRKIIDFFLKQRHICTDYFFSLPPIDQVKSLQKIIQCSKTSCVEIMVHPGNIKEFNYIMSEEYRRLIDGIEKGTYADL
jgi:chitin disaccharide deacetylase